jgi:sn-glycerol 3-phosphate transport system ATP-binding protein
MAKVDLSKIQKIFGLSQKAVHNVDVNIADGEFIVLVGPSGCGKTTLLRIVAGLESPTEGTVSIDGKVVNELAPSARNVAMVFQNYALYPHMNVFENMAYGLKIQKVPKEEIEKRVRSVAGILELSDEQLFRRPGQLSGGQRQRVAMGRAIVREPSVFLFDEPLSNLDAKLRTQMRLEIKKLQTQLNTTTIYVTHDQVEAMTLGHRLLVMNEGVAEQLGTPIEIYEKPESIFVAGFIGSPSMNFIKAKASADGTSVGIVGGFAIHVNDSGEGLEAGRDVVVGIRPEDFKLVDTNEKSGDFHLLVDVIELLGADTIIHGKFGTEGRDLTARLEGAQRIRSGDELAFTVAPDKLHLFDPDTKKRI